MDRLKNIMVKNEGSEEKKKNKDDMKTLESPEKIKGKTRKHAFRNHPSPETYSHFSPTRGSEHAVLLLLDLLALLALLAPVHRAAAAVIDGELG